MTSLGLRSTVPIANPGTGIHTNAHAQTVFYNPHLSTGLDPDHVTGSRSFGATIGGNDENANLLTSQESSDFTRSSAAMTFSDDRNTDHANINPAEIIAAETDINDTYWFPSSLKPNRMFTHNSDDTIISDSSAPEISHSVHDRSTVFELADFTSNGYLDKNTIRSSAQTLKSFIYSTGATFPNGTQIYDIHNHNNEDSSSAAILNLSLFQDNVTSSAALAMNATTNAEMDALSDMPSVISLNYSLPMMIIISVLLLTLVIITAFGNFLVGLALFKFKNLRTVSNYLIGNLALSDFLLATTILPLSAVNEAMGHWVFGRYMCYLWLCIDVLYCTASIWNLCMIAFDRFTATLYPLWYREKRSAKQAALYITIVWFIAVLVCIPPILGWNDITKTYFFDEKNRVYQCFLFDKASYVVYSASGSFFIPFVLTIFLYVRIFIVLRKRIRTMNKAKKAQCRPLLQQPSETPNKPVVTSNTLQVRATEIEMTPTTGTSTVTSHNTSQVPSTSEESSRSHSSESATSRNSDEEEENHVTVNQNGGSKGETEGLLSGSAVTHNNGGSTLTTPPLIVYNSNYHGNNGIVTSASNGQGGGDVTDLDKVKVIVTVENCNGKSSANDEAIKNIKSTTVKPTKGGKKQAKTDSNGNNNISQFKFINLIRSPKKSKAPRGASTRHRRQDRETKATIRMAIIIAFFCGFWIGFFTTYLLRGIAGDDLVIPRQLDAIFFWLGYSNSAINPILYTIFNEDFRRAFQKILGCYRKNRRPGGYART